MKHELRQMRAQGSGAIVNCSSLGGLVGNPGRAVLPRHQARRPRPHQERRAGVRAARHPHQRRLPRHDRDPDGRRHDRQRRAHRRRRRSRASRSAASAAATRSPPPSCGCAARARASWSASRCPSTAATPPAEPPSKEPDHDEPPDPAHSRAQLPRRRTFRGHNVRRGPHAASFRIEGRPRRTIPCSRDIGYLAAHDHRACTTTPPRTGTASCASASSTVTWPRSSDCPKVHA